jgi:hypothetical protein
VVALGAVLGTGGFVGLAAPAQAAVAQSVSFSTPGAYSWTVPPSVTSLQVSVSGAAGGSNAFGTPGRGDTVSATVPVVGGRVLSVTVGSKGGLGSDRGVPGGGSGGLKVSSTANLGGAGGGYSAIVQPTGTVVVAGGGGGAANTVAGGDAGHDGGGFRLDLPFQGHPGGAGSATQGGAGGAAGTGDPSCPDPIIGDPGAMGGSLQGGAGSDTSIGDGGGGGGGGYFGGGGGGAGVDCPNASTSSSGGGGGGSSFVEPQGSDVTATPDTVGDGSVTIVYQVAETTPPTANPEIGPGAPNANGWSREAAVVNWLWKDDSGVDNNSCTQRSTSTEVNGTQTLSASCSDVWGNVGSASVTVKIDDTDPTSAPQQVQTPAGTTIDWNWSDATSGVDPSQCQQQSTTPNTTGLVTATCTDLAGNIATGTYTVQDKTAPTDEPVVTPAANAAGWHNTDVTVTWNWADNGSGLNPERCDPTLPVRGEGFEFPASGVCQDLAGNQGSDILQVNIDKTKPVDDPVVSATATGASVAWNWSDALSGVDPASCTQSSSQSGTGQLTLTASCTDVAGNTAADSKTVTVSAPASKADVQVRLTGPASGSKGTAYTYTVTTKDAGPGAAKNVVSTLLLPERATLVSATGSPLRWGPLLTWAAPSVASGGSVSYTVKVRFPAPPRGAKSQTWALGAAAASLPTRTTSATPDPNLLNNLAAVLTRIS